MKNRFVLILIAFVFVNSCESNTEDALIRDIWLGDYSIQYYALDSVGEITYDIPLLIDFATSDSAVYLEQNGYSDTVLWNFNDSILFIDSTSLKIVSVSIDSLVLQRVWSTDNSVLNDSLSHIDSSSIMDEAVMAIPITEEYYIFKRVEKGCPIEKNIDYNILIGGNLFERVSDDLELSWPDKYIEFFNNRSAISREVVRGPNSFSFFDCFIWKVLEYKEYYFLVFYNDMYIGNMFNDYGFQIVEINDSSFVVKATNQDNLIRYNSVSKCQKLLGDDELKGN